MVATLVFTLLATAVQALVPSPGLPENQRDRLARCFAPTLVFHPDEEYFPVSPLTSGAAIEPGSPATSSIDPVDVRTARYLALPRSARAALAVVSYRVEARPEPGRRRVSIEYFFYYLGNPYRSRGGVIPIQLELWHPHDLEHALFIVEFPADTDLATVEPEQGRVVAVYPSAHGVSMPDNIRHSPKGAEVARPPRLIVELGSHAMALDSTGRGVFTPRADADGPKKFTWGIRDHGAPWAWYRARYMDARGHDAVVLGRSTYRLAPVDELGSALDKVARSASADTGPGRPSWAVRSFGEANPDELLTVPPPVRLPDATYGDREAARHERGFTIGASNILSQISLLAGGRWLVATPSLLPDVMMDAVGVLTHDGRCYTVVDVVATYRLDFATRLFVGGGPLVRWRALGRTEVEWDWVAGLEFHLGRLRVRQAARRIGVLNGTGYEARVSYAF